MENYKTQLLKRILGFRRRNFFKIRAIDFQSQSQEPDKKIVEKNKEKGTEFEKFVVRLFNPNIFILSNGEVTKV